MSKKLINSPGFSQEKNVVTWPNIYLSWNPSLQSHVHKKTERTTSDSMAENPG